MHLHPTLAGVRAVVFDLDGVLYEEVRPVPGAREVVTGVAALGLPIRFLTNTTSIGRAGIAAKLRRFGFDAAPGQVFSPGHAAARYLRDHQLSARLFLQATAREDFDGVSCDEPHPDAVVVGDLADGWTYDRLNEAFRLVHEDGARLIGLGRSRFWRSARGLLLDVGPFLAALECATGRQALVFGKPERAIFDAVVHDLALTAGEVVMVGDDIERDIEAARRAGVRTVLVRTGKFRPDDLATGIVPELVLDSVADLVTSGA